MDAIASKNSSKSMKSFEPLCQADFDSMPSTCDEDGHRKVDKFGLAVIFIGILLTGIGNSAFYTFGVAYLGRDHLSFFWIALVDQLNFFQLITGHQTN